MAYPWRSRRDAPVEEETPGLRDIAPVPAAPVRTFRLFRYTWHSPHGAAALGYTRILAGFLLSGRSPNERDTLGRTPLQYAVENDQHEAVRMLLNADADPNLGDCDGQTPLLWAAFLGRHWAVDCLRDNGAKIGFAEAVGMADEETASRMPTNAALDAPIADGPTLLTYAAERGDFGIVRLLLERGADPNARDGNGQRPLDAAAEVSRGRVLRLLLDWGADPTRCRTVDVATILAWAGRESGIGGYPLAGAGLEIRNARVRIP